MDSKLFSEWFHDCFVPSARKFCRDKGINEKVLLLVDNAPSHPSSATLHSEDGKVKTLFLPSNTTSAIQPMDQGVLEPMKKWYKRKLLSLIIMENESPDLSVPDILKKVTLKDMLCTGSQLHGMKDRVTVCARHGSTCSPSLSHLIKLSEPSEI